MKNIVQSIKKCGFETVCTVFKKICSYKRLYKISLFIVNVK